MAQSVASESILTGLPTIVGCPVVLSVNFNELKTEEHSGKNLGKLDMSINNLIQRTFFILFRL